MPVTFFNLPTIQQAWWESHDKPPTTLISLGDKNDDLQLCSFDNGKTLQFLGDQDVSDYLNWNAADLETAQQKLQDFLQKNKAWKTLKLVSLPQSSTMIKAVKDITSKNNWNFTQDQQDVAPIISLPQTWDEYLHQIEKKQRNEIQRKLRRLEKDHTVKFHLITQVSQYLTDFKTFFKLHKASGPEKAKFWTTEHKIYFEKLTQAAWEGDWLRLYFLEIDGEMAAVLYCFEYQDSLLVYNSGFDAEKYMKLSPGQVLIAYTIQDAIKRGLKTYDFLRGAEEYKFRFGAEPVPVYNVTVQR